MTDSAKVDARPFYLPGGPAGVLLIHGYTGSPAEMRLMGGYLNERGLTVAAPLLPGHGTTPEDLNQRRWQEWTDYAEGALLKLQESCQTVFVAGLSMGGLVSLYLAARHPELAGLITMAPALNLRDRRQFILPLAKYVVSQMVKSEGYMADPEAESYLVSYDVYPLAGLHQVKKMGDAVKNALPRISCPLLVIYSLKDDTVRPEGPLLVYERAGSADKALLELKESGHVIPVDAEWRTAAEAIYQFMVIRG